MGEGIELGLGLFSAGSLGEFHASLPWLLVISRVRGNLTFDDLGILAAMLAVNHLQSDKAALGEWGQFLLVLGVLVILRCG